VRLAATLLAALALVAAGCGDDSDTGDGPLTIEDALRSAGDAPVTVKGSYVETNGRPRLCSALLESHPPQCGQPSVGLEGEVFLDDLEAAGAVRWSNHEVAVRGDLRNGVLVIRETVR
jgi:hypothetical protein